MPDTVYIELSEEAWNGLYWDSMSLEFVWNGLYWDSMSLEFVTRFYRNRKYKPRGGGKDASKIVFMKQNGI
jgi:hypothetical protein